MSLATQRDLALPAINNRQSAIRDRSDLDLIFATDSVEEAIAHIREKAITPFGLKLVVRRNLAWLGERALPAS